MHGRALLSIGSEHNIDNRHQYNVSILYGGHSIRSNDRKPMKLTIVGLISLVKSNSIEVQTSCKSTCNDCCCIYLVKRCAVSSALGACILSCYYYFLNIFMFKPSSFSICTFSSMIVHNIHIHTEYLLSVGKIFSQLNGITNLFVMLYRALVYLK